MSQAHARKNGAFAAKSDPRNGGYVGFPTFGFCYHKRRVMQLAGQPSKTD